MQLILQTKHQQFTIWKKKSKIVLLMPGICFSQKKKCDKATHLTSGKNVSMYKISF